MRLNGTSAFSSIALGEKNEVPREVQVLRTGRFNHPRYGLFEITVQTLAEMKAHFDNRTRGIDLAFDYFHESEREAAAWVKSMELRENGTELWAEVDWTPKAAQKLSDRELRYFSPDFAFKWTDPETSVEFQNVLFGGGLTNRPFVKEMKAIVAAEKEGENVTELEKAQAKIKELEGANVKLSEEKAAVEKQMADMPKPDKVAELEAKIAALQAELEKEKAAAAQMGEAKAKLEEQMKCAEKEKEFNILLSEGKACAAQKDAFMKGDMAAFIKLAEPVNTRASGHSNTPAPDADAAAVIKLAEEKQKADPKLTRGDAISLAKKELKK